VLINASCPEPGKLHAKIPINNAPITKRLRIFFGMVLLLKSYGIDYRPDGFLQINYFMSEYGASFFL
jgi:hypothetical protein